MAAIGERRVQSRQPEPSILPPQSNIPPPTAVPVLSPHSIVPLAGEPKAPSPPAPEPRPAPAPARKQTPTPAVPLPAPTPLPAHTPLLGPQPNPTAAPSRARARRQPSPPAPIPAPALIRGPSPPKEPMSRGRRVSWEPERASQPRRGKNLALVNLSLVITEHPPTRLSAS